MERRFFSLVLGLCLMLGSAQASDESSGSYWPTWLQLGGQLRGRFEDLSAPALAGTGKDDFLYLSRLRFNVRVKARSWLRFFAQVQDAHVIGYDGTPPSSMLNPIDLRQGYVEVGGEGAEAVRMRVGRQEIALGSQLLVGISNWGNVTRSFDGARLSVYQPGIALDVLAASAVLIDPSRFDRHRPGEHLYGSYLGLSKILPGASVEPYAFVKHTLNVLSEKGTAGDALTVTIGARVIGKADYNLDYSAEVAAQRGAYSTDRVSSLAGVYIVGWTLASVRWTPRFSLEYKHSSGDAAGKDGVRQTFDQLYPSMHGFAGIADQVAWKNIRDPQASVEINITKKLKLQNDYNDFFLATVQDGLYNSGGTRTILNRAATSSHVGWEADLSASYQQSKHLQFGAGFGHIFAGQYLRESTSKKGYSYPYFMWVADF
jgi:hypothetical protein